MTDASDAIVQNLIDAGCDKQFIEKFMPLLTERKTGEMLSLLAGHRKNLLDCIHSEERQVYCLDYLVNQLKK
ncbi:MAG: hypothetical protein K2L88_02340 [Clostridiales bacterium]|nr:hypothetical protein [Clostridiales bacterium]